MIRRFLLALVFYSLPATPFHGYLAAQATEGVIRGTVLNEKGQPVFKAKVNALLADNGPHAGGIRYVESDEAGRFAIDRLAWGTYRIFAMKEDEGYPNTLFGFYSENPPTATLSPQTPSADVSLFIGPKAGVLRVLSLTDAVTGKSLMTVAGITFRRVDNPHFLGTDPSLERILVPSATDVTVEIEASGYAPWPQPNEAKLGRIRLQPDEILELRVELQPLSGLASELTRIVRRAADANRRVLSHGKITGPFPPPEADIARLKELGDQGIEALAEYLQPAKNPLEQGGAVSLLANLGGDQSLDLLEEFALKAENPLVRSSALTALAASQRPKDALLLQRIATDDPDPKVRAEAAKLLGSNPK